MVTKLIPPQLGRLDEEEEAPAPPRPNLRSTPRRAKPRVESVLTSGFVGEVAIAPPQDPGDQMEGLTIEVPRRLKRALQAEVARRRDDPERRSVASMKSVILEALAGHGFAEVIRDRDIEVQAGIFMKRQSAQMKRR
ncbi:hypothetical protein [Acidisphaera sp. L21]|uniref:hypothetical protein n=1 Tax=Acidisphaera sp. L21 TaxID=1641851 RepID=UPI00131AB1F4|nr:hypothetical protein [Acidisphaera sp. L21]